jgi:hypothetical protein
VNIEDDVAAIIAEGKARAGRNGQAPGSHSRADEIRRALLTGDQVRALAPPEPLVEGLLYRDSLALLYGPSGLGKSLTALDVAQHVAHARPWMGRPVTPGPVLYVVAEGVSGTGLRLDAWDAHHAPASAAHPVHWLPGAVNVHDPDWAEALAEVVAELAPVLVVVDTYARCTAGAEENSARDTGRTVAHLDLIRRAARSCVLSVHHTGKDTTAGARGSSALRGAMDTELELSGSRHAMRLDTRKQKDAPEAPPIHLAVTPVAGTRSVVVVGASRSPDMPPVPTVDQAVTDYFGANPDVELTQRQAVEFMRAHWHAHDMPGYRHETIREALDRLAIAGTLTRRPGPRQSYMYTLTDHGERASE